MLWPVTSTQYSRPGLWDQGVYPRFCDTRASPLYMGGWSLGGPFCCITVVISHNPGKYSIFTSISHVYLNHSRPRTVPRLMSASLPEGPWDLGGADIEMLRFASRFGTSLNCPGECGWSGPQTHTSCERILDVNQIIMPLNKSQVFFHVSCLSSTPFPPCLS